MAVSPRKYHDFKRDVSVARLMFLMHVSVLKCHTDMFVKIFHRAQCTQTRPFKSPYTQKRDRLLHDSLTTKDIIISSVTLA